MAKKCMINRQKKREKLVRKFAAKRELLKEQSKNMSLSPEERQTARAKLAKLPRNSSPVRLGTRCVVTGRSRAIYREFMLSRIAFRQLALQGRLPGIHKSSW